MKHTLKVKHFCQEVYEKVSDYFETDSKGYYKESKVGFFGLVFNPNNGGLWNFDILSVYRAFQEEAYIQSRMHDPHIKGPQALEWGVWLGRQSEDDNWSHSFDAVIISTPHLYYYKNIDKMAHLCKPDKRCLFLDLFGGLVSVESIGDHIDYVSFLETTKKWGIGGGLLNQVPKLGN